MYRWKCYAGFGLIDVLIALTIIAILAALAYPDFRASLQRSRRVDAVTSLLSVRAAQEKWRANHPSYAELTELGWTDAVSTEGYYQLRLLESSAAAFFALAEPQPDGPQQDDPCGVFAIDQRGPVFEGYADAACWRR